MFYQVLVLCLLTVPFATSLPRRHGLIGELNNPIVQKIMKMELCQVLEKNWDNPKVKPMLNKLEQYGLSEDQLWDYIDTYLDCSKKGPLGLLRG